MLPFQKFPDIRNLYEPVQPTLKKWDKEIIYQEFLPDTDLQSLIYCYWQLRTTAKLSEQFTYRVVADGCIDVFFDARNPQESFVTGFCKKFIEFPLENEFHYIGIRFLPTMFTQLFKINAATLSNQTIPLSFVVPGLAHFIDSHFTAAENIGEPALILDNKFLQLRTAVTFNCDLRLYNAITKIISANGVLNIEKDIDTGISPRQLRRLFMYYIGDSAKTFSQVVRFQSVVRSGLSLQQEPGIKIFPDEGYYDQSHFIKEFRTFYGTTPSGALGE